MSVEIVINSNLRIPILRETEIKPGNSATQGAQLVDQTLNSRYLSVSFLTKDANSFASRSSSVTFADSQLLLSSATSEIFSRHFVEQPNGLVTATETGLPANNSMIAFFKSCFFTVAGSANRELSKRPRYCSFRFLSNTNICGVALQP